MPEAIRFINRYGCGYAKPNKVQAVFRTGAYGLVIDNDCLLMIKPVWADLWELPGGGIDQGEGLEEGLIREFHEEVGCSVAPDSLRIISNIKCNFYADDLDEFWYAEMTFFSASLNGGLLSNAQDTSETAEISWLPIDSLASIDMHYIHKDVVMKYLDIK